MRLALLLCCVAGPALADPCAALRGAAAGDLQVTDAAIVTSADLVTDASTYPPMVTPPFCRVQAVIEGAIGMELWLPPADAWNARLLTAGVGGPAGQFNFTDMSTRLAQGFATLSTDGGHKVGDDGWMADPAKRADYEHRATHLATVEAKRLIAGFYGTAAERSYFLGCSGGGRQGLKEVQNYPADYDGVVAGAPGPNMPTLTIRMMWTGLMQKADPDAAPTDRDWQLYEAAATEACGTDGVIMDPRACTFDVMSLACEGEDCIAPDTAAMMARMIGPMPDENGDPMDDGMLPAVRTRPGPPSPLVAEMFTAARPDWTEAAFSPSVDLAAFHEQMPELAAGRTDLSVFAGQGGKLIVYQGWQDPSTLAGPLVDYFERIEGADDAARLFMVPGMYHCRGGAGADSFGGSRHIPTGDPDSDILWSVIRWVEEGQAPQAIAATGGTDMRLCPHPALAGSC